jgi:hypothetical protein
MNVKKLGVSDDANTSFAPHIGNMKQVNAGFDAGDAGNTSPGHHRFPRRKSKEEIPQEPLAKRLRAHH